MIKAGLFPHFHLLVQTEGSENALTFAQKIHLAWVKSARTVVRKARRQNPRAYDWINLKAAFCDTPRLDMGTVNGGVHVRKIEHSDPAELQRAVKYAASELVVNEAKHGKRNEEGHNRLRSYSIGELLDQRKTKLEGFARSAFRLYVQLIHGLPSHMYSRGKSRGKPQMGEGAHVARKERKGQGILARLANLEIHERADSEKYRALLTTHTTCLLRGLDEWQSGYYLPEAVPAFETDGRGQAEKRQEIIDAIDRIMAGYRAHLDRNYQKRPLKIDEAV